MPVSKAVINLLFIIVKSCCFVTAFINTIVAKNRDSAVAVAAAAAATATDSLNKKINEKLLKATIAFKLNRHWDLSANIAAAATATVATAAAAATAAAVIAANTIVKAWRQAIIVFCTEHYSL